MAIDPEKIEKPSGFKLFVDDVEVNAGVTSDQLFVSRSVIYMSDMLGDRRFIASLDSVSSFSNFDFLYLDLHNRTNWGFRVFDNRSFFNATISIDTDFIDRPPAARIARPARSASSAIRSTAITASISAAATRRAT